MALIGTAARPRRFCSFLDSELGLSDTSSLSSSLKFLRWNWNAVRFDAVEVRSRLLTPIKAAKEVVNGRADVAGGIPHRWLFLFDL